jgi:hypothetical protein
MARFVDLEMRARKGGWVWLGEIEKKGSVDGFKLVAELKGGDAGLDCCFFAAAEFFLLGA